LHNNFEEVSTPEIFASFLHREKDKTGHWHGNRTMNLEAFLIFIFLKMVLSFSKKFATRMNYFDSNLNKGLRIFYYLQCEKKKIIIKLSFAW
jgi:hypothetical protein